MNKMKIWIGLFVGLAGLASSVGATPQIQVMFGRVGEDAPGGGMLADVLLTARDEALQVTIATTRTDEFGNYILTLAVAEGPLDIHYSVVPTKPGFTFQPFGVTHHWHGGGGNFRQDFGAIRLMCWVSGRVREQSGVALSGVPVGIQSSWPELPISLTWTDATGRFRFRLPAAHWYQVTPMPAVGSGFSPANRTLYLLQSEWDLDFTPYLFPTAPPSGGGPTEWVDPKGTGKQPAHVGSGNWYLSQ